MKLLVLLAIVVFQVQQVFADTEKYEYKNCAISDEYRGVYKGTLGNYDICIQEMGCERFAKDDDSVYSEVRLKAYCQSVGSDKRCPEADYCIKDDYLSADEMSKVIPLSNRPPRDECGDTSTVSDSAASSEAKGTQ